MFWAETVKEYTQSIEPIKTSPVWLERILRMLDLTSLNDEDTEASIARFLQKAQLSFGHVAAVCLYPSFVRMAATQFAGSPVQVATVVNFPEGSSTLDSTLIAISNALQDGAQEIDVVFPYPRYLAGERQYAHHFIEACKAACGDNVLLKVILETGALVDPAIIADASLDALTAGADFIKTSTGKIAEGATLEAAAVMLLVVKHATPQLKRRLGVKISGGVREIQQAAQYVELADNIMGKGWATPETFRIGASKLLDEIVKEMMK